MLARNDLPLSTGNKSLCSQVIGHLLQEIQHGIKMQVKRYGGFPLIKNVQDVNGGDALFVPRFTEKEV